VIVARVRKASDVRARRKYRGESLAASGRRFVNILRAAPADEAFFRPMDYVTLSPKFAREHAEHQAVVEEEPQHVLSAIVPAEDVYEAPNPGEYFYDGRKLEGKVRRINPGRKKMPRHNPAEDDYEEEIIEGMARALWVSDWAQREEEKGVSFSGMELMDIAPPTPQGAEDAARLLAGGIIQANKASLTRLLAKASKADGDYADPEDFGHYLAMMALDTGVSWFDRHEEFPLKVPPFEAYDLDD